MTNVLLEKKGNIAVATINRPKALNALNSEVLADLGELVEIVKADSEIRALVITGSGEKAFVAGADIGEMSTLTVAEGEAFGKKGNDIFRKLETMPIPVIAEGRVHYPDQARKMLQLGAHAVVVGGAITRPLEIAQRFYKAIEK